MSPSQTFPGVESCPGALKQVMLQPTIHLTIEAHYWQIYYEVLEYAIVTVKPQFDQPGYAKYQQSEELRSACGEHYSAELTSVAVFYGDDFDRHHFSAQLTSIAAQFEEAEQRRQLSLSLSMTSSHTSRAFLLQNVRSSLK